MVDKKTSEEDTLPSVSDATQVRVTSGAFSFKVTFAQIKTWINSWIDATLVPFIQEGLDAVVRTVQEKLREDFSVTDFGGVGDDVTSNDAAFASAVLAAYTRSNSLVGLKRGRVVVPCADKAYKITAPITLLRGVDLIGQDGAIILAVDCDAVALGGVTGFGQQKVTNLNLQGSGPTAARSAFVYVGDENSGNIISGVLLEDNQVQTFDTFFEARSLQEVHVFRNRVLNVNQGIVATGVFYNARIKDNTMVYGAGGGVGAGNKEGISLYAHNYTTSGGSLGPEGIKITDNLIYGFDYGIDADQCDTLNIVDNIIVANIKGIRYKDVTTLCNIRGNNVEMHNATALIGIHASQLTGAATTHFSVIRDNIVQGSTVGGIATTACWGIQVNASGQAHQGDVVISDNYIKNMQGYDIAVYSPKGMNKVVNNKCLSSATTGSILAGTPPGAAYALLLEDNYCAKTIDYAVASDLTNGYIRSRNNFVSGSAAENDTWTITASVAPFMTFAGPATSRKTYTLVNASDTLLSLTATQSPTNKTHDNTNTYTTKDVNFTIQDDGDVTKQAKFQASGITAGQTRTMTIPDFDTTLAGLAGTQTFTGAKTFTASCTFNGITFGADGSTCTFGPGGSGAVNATLVMSGSDGTGVGARFIFKKNSVNKWALGDHASVTGGGTSADLMLVNLSVGSTNTIRFGVADDSVIMVGDVTGNSFKPASFTVAALPAGAAGKTVFCSNVRVFNGAGTQEGAGVGTGGLVTHNGTAYKIEGTNVTAVA